MVTPENRAKHHRGQAYDQGMDRQRPITPEIVDLIAKTLLDAGDAAFSFDMEHPSPNAPVLQDRAAVAELGGDAADVRGRLLDTSIDGALTALAAMRDSLSSLGHDVIRKPPPIWSPMIQARAILESVVMIRYILDPGIEIDRRVARIAGLLVVEADNAHNLAVTFDRESQSERPAIITEMRRGGILIKGAPRSSTVTVGAIKIKADYTISAEVRTLLPPDAPEPYRLFSAPGHARPWGLQRTATAKGGEFEGEAATLGAVLLVVIYALEAFVTAWAGYFGYDESGALSRLDGVRKVFAEAWLTI